MALKRTRRPFYTKNASRIARAATNALRAGNREHAAQLHAQLHAQAEHMETLRAAQSEAYNARRRFGTRPQTRMAHSARRGA